jgi:hypothetical protein
MALRGTSGPRPPDATSQEAREPWISPNEADWDRWARIAAGLLILGLGWSSTLPGLWGAAARIFGVVPLVTGLMGWSPLYAILGFATRNPSPSRPEGPRTPPAAG